MRILFINLQFARRCMMMIKFRELLFLKSLKRVGKVTIYKKYWNILINSNDFNELVSKMELELNFSKSDMDSAIETSKKLYDDALNNSEIQVITVFDEAYPEKLNVMGNKRPLILYVKGNVDALTMPNISVIGTRKPSIASEDFERDLVKKIVNEYDLVVVSGLALGCDKIAHQATVDENKPTIAVLPGGLDKISPAKNRKLAEKILKTGGCLVSEYELGKKAFKGTYVERDQIVAAFGDATFVVECGIKSGTMHTVEAALKYDRNVLTFIPENIPEGEFEGNQSIDSAIRITDIDEFNKDMISYKKSAQQTLI